MTRRARAGMRAGLQSAGVVLVASAVVASAQSLTDCDLAAQRAIQAAHDQYERELRACNNQPACLQGSFDRWIVASKNTEKVRSQCRARAQTPQRDPSAPAPGTAQTPQTDNTAVCDEMRTRQTTAAANQYINVVRTCQSSQCVKAALDTRKQADDDAEQKYNACRANRQAAKGPLQGGVSTEVRKEPLYGGVGDYNSDYGQKLPAMTGQVPYQGTMLYVDTAEGHLVGQGIEGPVKCHSVPARFSRAQGMLKGKDMLTGFYSLEITKLWDMQGNEVDPVPPISVQLKP